MTRVLVIEDDPVICWDLQRQLQFIVKADLNYFEKMSEASEFLRQNQPDLIITNLRLLDGWVNQDFLRHLQSVSCPLIILTGMRDSRFHPKLADDVPISFLYKPFTQRQLKRLVEYFF